MWRQVVAQSPCENAPAREILRYDVGWKALNTMLKSGRSLSGHERNCCFLNTGGQRFADISAVGDIDFPDDGRVLAPTDWDLDGDIDFWIANRTGPQVRFMRNDHDNDHSFVSIKLEGVTCNRDAIGAKLELHVEDEVAPVRYKSVRSGEGYLAQTSKWIHFGLGNCEAIEKLVVKWPDGDQQSFGDVVVNHRYQIKQGENQATSWDPPNRKLALSPSKIVVPKASDQARIGLIAPVPIPKIIFQNEDGVDNSIFASGRPRLINLWATWCQPCLEELAEWKAHESELARSGVEIVTINVDEPEVGTDARKEQINRIRKIFEDRELPFTLGFGDQSLVAQFDVLQRSILRRQRPLPVPTSFLVDGRGHLRVIYKGPVDATQIIKDTRLINASAEDVVAASVPFSGKWLGQPAGSAPNQIAIRFIEGGFVKGAEGYIRQLREMKVDNPLYNPAEANVLLGALLLDQQRLAEAAEAFESALALDPNHRQSHIEVAGIFVKLGEPAKAAIHFEVALEQRKNDPELRLKLGEARLQNGELQEAYKQFTMSSELRPTAAAHHNRGNVLLALGEKRQAIAAFESALEVDARFLPSANNLAWLLATSADENSRDGKRAVELAELICNNPSARSPSNLDTLAVAYAEVADFENAIKTAEEAVRLAKGAGDLKTSGEIQKRLKLFRQNKPYRDG